jgi:pimeloyl-ACP methyl ester carboxylesterase
MPGSPRELDLFGDRRHLEVLALDRARYGITSSAYDAMATTVAQRFPDQDVCLVAFSLGTQAAFELASRLSDRVCSIDLISAGAPLSPDDHEIAGYRVFRAAQKSPLMFGGLARVQALSARLAPSLLYALLFKTAKGADDALSRTKPFRTAMQVILTECFEDGGRNYCAEISAYVAQWATLPAMLHPPVTLWHGTADNWAPIAMTERLARTLPNVAAVHRLEGLSHYSTLQVALTAILGAAGPVEEAVYA